MRHAVALSVRFTDVLRTIDLFADLSADDLGQLSHCMRDRQLSSGEVVWRAGQPYRSMVIVVGGSIELVAPALGGRPASARRLSSGESFGETALISSEPQPGTATAISDTRVLELDKDDFEAFVSAHPRVMRAILAAISRRAVQTNQRLLTDQPTDAGGVSSTHVYSVFSPRGGAGKTLLSTRLAIRLAALMPQRVALLDLDLLFSDAALQLEVGPFVSLGSLAEEDLQRMDAQVLTSLLTEHSSGLRVVVGAGHPEEGERITAAHVRAVLCALKRQFLATVIDCGGSFSEATLAALEMSDRIMVVCTPELVTLRDVRDCRRVLGPALHLDKNRLTYLFNHPSPSVGLKRGQFEDALEQHMLLEIPYAGDGATRSGFDKPIDQLAAELRSVASKHGR